MLFPNERPTALHVTLLAAALTPFVAAGPQDSAEVSGPAERALTPTTAVDPSAKPKSADERPEIVTDPTYAEAAPGVPAELDDSIPLPVRAQFDNVEGVDVVVEEASGDPFFLGFAGGDHYPPATEILDPLLVEAAGRGAQDLRPDAVTYGFVMFSKRITKERRAELEALGCRILGFHPHYTLKVAVPTDAIGDVSVLDFVRWVGVARPKQKVHPATERFVEETPEGLRTPLYVSVFEGDDLSGATETRVGTASTTDPGGLEVEVEDARSIVIRSNGWMQRAIEELGVDVLAYTPRQKVFRVDATAAQIEALTALDFVQFVEPIGDRALTAAPHDESRAMTMTDRIRIGGDGSTNTEIVMGIIDSGVETSHQDLNFFGVGWNCSTGSSPWNDTSDGGDGHGTHVAGTLFGRGVAEPDQLGNAPGLGTSGTGRVYNYRYFPTPCNVGLDSIVGTFSNSFTDGGGATTRKPHIVNNSWRTTYGVPHTGTEFEARVSDDAVFDEDQLWVWASSNDGPGASSVSAQGAAKNSFTVGNVIDYENTTVGDPGNLWTSSGRGPTTDGRWKPSVTAPGRWIRSCLADDNDGYEAKSGTSMSSPHVASAAAMLMDRRASMRDRPELTQAVMMATAITDDNASITNDSATHLDNYGAGRINAYKAAFGFGGNTYNSWYWENGGANWTFADFTVPAGCTRLVAVMTCLEESASAGASSALINDWDFYLDRDPIDPAGDTGEYFAQQSSVNNNEIRIINNPQAGPWRWKVYPDSVTTTTKIGICVYYIVDDTTPDATLTLTASDAYVQPNEDFDLTANVDVDDYCASAVILDRSGSFATTVAATTTLGDGVVTDLLDNPTGGADVTLGDIADFHDRAATWTLRYTSEGTKTATVEARSDNMIDKTASVTIVVDGTEPGAVGSLSSPSHTVGQWSNDPTITYTWTAATDDRSGIDGYGIFETGSASIPGSFKDIESVTSYTSPTWSSSSTPRYFNIRSVDNSGNWDSDFVSTGPYYIDTTAPGAPTISSTTHPFGSARCENTVTVNWNASSDAHSGVTGYSYVWSLNPSTSPDLILDTAGTSSTQTLPIGTWYLNVRARDNAGNWGSSVASFGPMTITADCGVSYCNANANSTGLPGRMRAFGTDDVSANDLVIESYQLPPNQFGMLNTSLASSFVANPGGSQGHLCLGGSIGRYTSAITNSGPSGSFQIVIDLTAVPTPFGTASVVAGQTRHWQTWHRDSNPGSTSNFTEGLRVRFY